MNFDCIVSQVHVPAFDVQGGLNADQKLHLVEFGLRHLREFNVDSYIILSGHGLRPHKEYLEMCDHVIWNDNSEPLNEHGYVIGMPAQYKYVSRGLIHAKEKGFDNCLKTRGDCVIGIRNITGYCQNILDLENKKLLITQQTGHNRIGDCFMYGDLDMLCNIWDGSRKMHDPDGLKNTAINFHHLYNHDELEWTEFVHKYCSFRDVDILKFMCFRWNYFKLNELNKQVCDDILNPDFDYNKYHWGRALNWHIFDEYRNMTGTSIESWSQKQYYK